MSEQLNEAMQVLDFLAGTGELEGCGFGDKPAGVQGNYWWRRHLPKIRYALSTHHAAPADPYIPLMAEQAMTIDRDTLRSALLWHGISWGEDSDEAFACRLAQYVNELTRDIDAKRRAAATAPAGGVTDEQIDAAAAPWLCPDGQANPSDVRQIVRAVLALTTAARAAEPAPQQAQAAQHSNELIEALEAAAEWIGRSAHGDNCYVSDHYEGDPGDRCNCGKESIEGHINHVLALYATTPTGTSKEESTDRFGRTPEMIRFQNMMDAGDDE